MKRNRYLRFFIFSLFIGGLAQGQSARGATLFGIDVLKKEKFKSLKGAHVALITNHTGLSKNGTSTVDLFNDTRQVELQAILSPEHGFSGSAAHGEKVSNSIDNAIGVPIFSLYGETNRPTDEMLKGVDTIVFDIQDIGSRIYTYISTMGMALEEAAKRNLKFVVLDRPNPIRGDIFEGDVLDPDIQRLTGYFQVPVRHGLTVGELALWLNKEKKLGANVVVIPLKGWRRSHWYDQTGYEFIAPSPNIPRLTSALLYSGMGSFEATNVSVGRGTNQQFNLFGAPWIDGGALAAHLHQFNFGGVIFEPVVFTPQSDIYAGQECRGVKIIVTDRATVRPFQIFLASFLYIYKNHSQDFLPDWEEVRVVTGSNKLRQAAENNIEFTVLVSQYEEVLASYRKKIKSFFLYP